MQQIWRGEAPMEGVPPIGPAPVRPGGPELLCGSFSPSGDAPRRALGRRHDQLRPRRRRREGGQGLRRRPRGLGRRRSCRSAALRGVVLLRARSPCGRRQGGVSRLALRASVCRGQAAHRCHDPDDDGGRGQRGVARVRRHRCRRSVARADDAGDRSGRSASNCCRSTDCRSTSSADWLQNGESAIQNNERATPSGSLKLRMAPGGISIAPECAMPAAVSRAGPCVEVRSGGDGEREVIEAESRRVERGAVIAAVLDEADTGGAAGKSHDAGAPIVVLLAEQFLEPEHRGVPSGARRRDWSP